MRSRGNQRGQSLAEFAIVFPVVMALIGGSIQFGILFWAQNTLTQVVRETGRWAATQPCTADVAGQETKIGSNGTNVLLGTREQISVIYWDAAKHASPPATSDALVVCPPADNSVVNYVSITVDQRVPVFIPGMEYLPRLGTCDASGCFATLSSTAQYRLEPKP